jgi:hypothetical protein
MTGASDYVSTAPDLRFHYTNAEGLKGILQSGKIWATDVRYLNDAQEVEYLFQLLDERLGTPIEAASDASDSIFGECVRAVGRSLLSRVKAV